jgi:hypothetical protein
VEHVTIYADALRAYNAALTAMRGRQDAYGSPHLRDAIHAADVTLRAAFDHIPALLGALSRQIVAGGAPDEHVRLDPKQIDVYRGSRLIGGVYTLLGGTWTATRYDEARDCVIQPGLGTFPTSSDALVALLAADARATGEPMDAEPDAPRPAPYRVEERVIEHGPGDDPDKRWTVVGPGTVLAREFLEHGEADGFADALNSAYLAGSAQRARDSEQCCALTGSPRARCGCPDCGRW